MDLRLLSHHRKLFSVFCGTLSISISLSLGLGEVKATPDIAWLDIVGEGSLVVLSIVWILALMASRPPGQVTSLLVLGLCFFLFSSCLDLFDEFILYQDTAHYLSVFESIPAAIGMFIMSYGLCLWYREGLVINQQLRSRELDFRQHQSVDFITKLYNAEYVRARINSILSKQSPRFSLVIFDIENFNSINQKFGYEEGDRILRELSELIVMNLRSFDLVCRYGSDRFVLLLPDTNQDQANVIAEQVKTSITHLALKPLLSSLPLYLNARYVTEPSEKGDHTADSILQRAGLRLEKVKLAS